MLASWTDWWSSWIWPDTTTAAASTTEHQLEVTTVAMTTANPSSAATTIASLTTRIASMSPTSSLSAAVASINNRTPSPPQFYLTHAATTVLIQTASTEPTTTDHLSATTSNTTNTSTTTTTTESTSSSSTTPSLWSTLFSNYTTWFPSHNGSYSSQQASTTSNSDLFQFFPFSNTSLSSSAAESSNNSSLPLAGFGRLAANLTRLHSQADVLIETIVGNDTSSGPFFETADFSEDELLFRLIWDNATASSGLHPNNDTNSSASPPFAGYDVELQRSLKVVVSVVTAIVLAFIILATVIGNVFVIAAILLERNLQSVANYLILSLAVADLLVACLVMPLSAVYEVSDEWNMGPELCDMWTSSDVLCCTASILHLVAIALDRYWAVTNIDYIHHRTARRICVMIIVVWALSGMVSIAPLFGWKDPLWNERVTVHRECIVSQDISYQIFATASSFYVPLLVILVLYWRIFQTARKRIRRRQQVGGATPSSGGLIASAAGGSGGIAAAVITIIGRPLPTISETTTAFTNVSSANTSPEKCSHANGPLERIENDPPTADNISMGYHSTPVVKSTIRKKHHSNSADSKRERKAAKTLAIITGAFVCCWLPFFILAILLPVCSTCQISPVLMSLFLWLGYFNSTLNPIIYTIFSPEFRNAFKRILCGKKSSIRRRTGVMRR